MQVAYLHQLATRAAILGTHRRQLPPELVEAFPALGIREDAPPAEQLLEAIGILDRLQRTLVPSSFTTGVEPQGEVVADEATRALNPRGVRTLELALGDTYRLALPEVVELLSVKNYGVPAHLLPAVLDLSSLRRRTGSPEFADQLFALAGPQGKWLAAQNPAWEDLLPPADWASEFKRLSMPSQRADLLRRWRAVDPEAALAALEGVWAGLTPKQQEAILPALRTGLGPGDQDFLNQALVPKRKEVRRIATLLLLQLPEANCYGKLEALAADWLKVDGPRLWFEVNKADATTLDNYGLNTAKKSPEESLLAHLPPDLWLTITGLPLIEFFPRLVTAGKHLLQALLRAVIYHEETSANWRTMLIRHFVYQDRPQAELSKLTEELYAQLTPQEYEELVRWSLKNVDQVFRTGSVLRAISLQLTYPWPDQLSKLVVSEFTDQFSYGRRAYGYGLTGNALWKTLAYRMNVALFPWLRQQLYAATERDDQYGNLATKMLQVLSFRKMFREGLGTE